MKGVGGPLLSIGDLLADLVEEPVVSAPPNPENSSKLETDAISEPLDLTGLFQDNYDKLNRAFAGSDHSWTSLTLELCTSLETANKLVHAPQKKKKRKSPLSSNIMIIIIFIFI